MRCASSVVPSVARDQRLGLAAGEQRRTVNAGQNADLDRDRANLVEGAMIGTDALVQHLVAEDLLAQQLVVLGELLGRGGDRPRASSFFSASLISLTSA